MEALLQNRYLAALGIALTVIAATFFAFAALNLDRAPRSYAEIMTTPTPSPQPTRARTLPVPTATFRPAPPTPSLTLAGAFREANWPPQTANLSVTASISNSAYLLRFSQPATGVVVWAQGLTLPNDRFSFQVEAGSDTPGRAAEYGLVFWHGVNPQTHEERALQFIASSAGWFRVDAKYGDGRVDARFGDERVEPLVPRRFTPALRSSGRVRMQVQGSGSDLFFFIDDTLVADVTAASIRSGIQWDGRVGLVASSNTGDLVLRFTNLQLKASPASR